MRVRLVRPLIAEIAQLDTVATRSVDPVGPAVSGYDDDFREPVLADTDSDGIGESQRQEKAPVQVPAQVEFGPFDRLQQGFGGAMLDSRVLLVMDYLDLERLGLIDPATNDALIRVNDRVVRILNRSGNTIETFPNPPGLYITQLEPGSGLEADRNILLASCADREQGLTRGL